MDDVASLSPDEPLTDWLTAPLDSRRRRAFFRSVGIALAEYVLRGGRLTRLLPEQCRVRKGRHLLRPPPPSRAPRLPWPDRRDLEAGLRRLESHPAAEGVRPLDRFRVMSALSRRLESEVAEATAWRATYCRERNAVLRRTLRIRYRVFLSSPGCWRDGFHGEWRGLPVETPAELHARVDASRAAATTFLKRGARAAVWADRLGGETVMIKQYAPNPRLWRRAFEISRARRAWAGARILQTYEIQGLAPLAWVEIREGPDRGASVFISRLEPNSEPVRTWMRREWPRLSPQERTLFRHRLRGEFMTLYAHGLAHLDSKLSNLRVAGSAVEDLRFTWSDLEDIRPLWFLHRAFVRNLYQLNGSLPRWIPREERIRMLRGFRSRFPYATHPLLIRYVAAVTRRRHRREFRRQCNA